MKKLVDIIGYIVLVGILIKLSYVFFHLFELLDGGSFFSKIVGTTYSCASMYFVIKEQRIWIKRLMVWLDVAIILYYYLYTVIDVPIEGVAVIVATYSGIIIYYLGAIVAKQLYDDQARRDDALNHSEATCDDTHELRQRIINVRRRIRTNRDEVTKEANQQLLLDLENRLANIPISNKL